MSDSEDEIDILGELPSPPVHQNTMSSYSELLKCEYTVHPQWLLDTSTTACWYDNPQPDEMLGISDDDDDDDNNQPSTSCQWSDSEKRILHKGLEIYGHDPQKLSVFLGTKSMSEVRLYVETEYGINLDDTVSHGGLSNEVIPSSTVTKYGEVLTDNEIPASIEEVICMVNTAEPTSVTKELTAARKPITKVSKNKSQPHFKDKSIDKGDVSADTMAMISEVCNKNESLLYGIPKRNTKIGFKSKHLQDDTRNNLKLYIDESKMYPIKKSKNSKFTVNLLNKSNLSRLGKQRSIKISKPKPKLTPTFKSKSRLEIVTGSGQALPLSEGEQVIKIEKYMNAETESDIEIDIDSDEDNKTSIQPDIASEIKLETKVEEVTDNLLPASDIKDSNCPEPKIDPKDERLRINIPDNLLPLMKNLDTPTEEWIIHENEVNEIEKLLCSEFFEGKVSKTPERYILIRSHIMNCWKQCQPIYLTKTTARQGLKNGGDVNSIGRVHTVLEQIGAINFGCEQTFYIRPLLDLLNNASNIAKTLSPVESIHLENKNEISRQRKKKLVIDDNVGGYTITHTESGEYIEAISEPKQQRNTKKKPINLIYCKVFNSEENAPYVAQLSLSTLILMDVHSYTSHAEIMGLLGGHFISDDKIIFIEKYIPCKSLEDSGTHCDMCPVSQSAATETLSNLGYETIGWHHSHPLFPPQPSAQDILSQADFQNAFSPRPFLALIVSPYWPPGRTASQYRCFVTKKEPNIASEYDVPYNLKMHLYSDLNTQNDVDNLLMEIKSLQDNVQSNKYKININDVCQATKITYLEKCVSSIRHHLNACGSKIPRDVFDRVLNGIKDIF